jgi:hypothetical protein
VASSQEATYYPERLCHMAPLRPAKAPLEGCECRVCAFFREPIVPVRPGTPAWDRLIAEAGAKV